MRLTVVRRGGALAKFCYNLAGFNKYGLHYDDCYNDLDPDVAEAVRRLPSDVQDQRVFRHMRAIQCSMMKVYLPEEEWTEYSQDNKYLQPYLQQVRAERQEREEWDHTH